MIRYRQTPGACRSAATLSWPSMRFLERTGRSQRRPVRPCCGFALQRWPLNDDLRTPITQEPAPAMNVTGQIKRALVLLPLLCLWLANPARAQDLPLTQQLTPSVLTPLDPTRNETHPVLERDLHTPLPEEYIWTANGRATGKLVYTFPGIEEQTEPHLFRKHFTLAQAPAAATLYLAGPRAVTVWINGALADRVSSDTSSPLGMHVFQTSVAKWLHAGDNVIAIRAVRGRGVTGFANSALVRQQTFGQVLVAKILPAAPGVLGADLLHSDASWLSTTEEQSGWERPAFQDAEWPHVLSLGGIESNIELFQWNADAGLFDWPGYDGISPFLAHMQLHGTVRASYTGRSSISGLEGVSTAGTPLRVHLLATAASDADAPSLLIDFHRELTGRLELVSASDRPITLTMQLGESESEALKSPYLGTNTITIAPHGTGHSPKTAFRYAKIRFLSGGGGDVVLQSISADHIYFPVRYAGSFESSDPLLNRIWEIGAYTAHLCMQDGVWDASKRDRGRWMGDTDVSGPVIEGVFGDQTLLPDTLDRLLGPDRATPVDQQVNGIPGYSSFWFTGVADYYRHSGDKAFLEREHARMLQLLQVVDREFDQRGLYANKSEVWLYVDWSPDLNGDTPETRRATTLEFVRAYKEAAYLLRELGDTEHARFYETRAQSTAAAANQSLADPQNKTFGPRWQTNAAAVISGTAKPETYDAIWQDVLSEVGKPAPAGREWPIITPYYGDYVLRAMARMNHRAEALAWIRSNWGGMVQEGATSFWEAYDPTWYKEDFHASLQADNRSGYFVSLAHGWSAGPTAWLTEEVLGIQPTGAGYSTVTIRPDLVDLTWAKGQVPTPRGLLHVDAKKGSHGLDVTVDLPPGTRASVSLPELPGLLLNGKPAGTTPGEEHGRTVTVLSEPGHYVFTQ